MHTEFNRRLVQAKLRALATIEELCNPADPQPDPGDPQRRPQDQDRALRLRAATTILKTRPIDQHGNPLPIARSNAHARHTDDPDATNPGREHTGQYNATDLDRQPAGHTDAATPPAASTAQPEYDGWRPWIPPSRRARSSLNPDQ